MPTQSRSGSCRARMSGFTEQLRSTVGASLVYPASGGRRS